MRPYERGKPFNTAATNWVVEQPLKKNYKKVFEIHFQFYKKYLKPKILSNEVFQIQNIFKKSTSNTF